MIKVKGKLKTWYYFHVHGIFANYWFDTKKVLRAEGSPFIYTSVILFTIIFQFFSSVTWIATRMCNLNLWVILPFEVFALSIFCMICHLQECSTFKLYGFMICNFWPLLEFIHLNEYLIPTEANTWSPIINLSDLAKLLIAKNSIVQEISLYFGW